MADTKNKDLDETKRIMERLVKTPPDHKGQTSKVSSTKKDDQRLGQAKPKARTAT
ncbi:MULTISPECIES: hypothetical protein [Mesorhizobium]|uniref:hypothetical protein n=1 Tax=Mesorhizobium TaxID=68287 RepID=UPI0012EC6893|nr:MULTISPECIES: hypothetical protein [Mesorhizobium]WJI37289.1 hypothetical protein NL534_25950 [Mesorhizobium opportunistum]